MLATVAERTAALCSVYHDGATLLQCIKSKRKGLDISATELELAITGAESAVRDQYERTSQRFGASYAQGDHIAVDRLLDISVHVQSQVIDSLNSHYRHNAFVDFTALQDVCDSSQDRAILILMQLQQRLITLGVTETVTPLPLNPANTINGDTSFKASDKADAVNSAVVTAVLDPADILNVSFSSPQTPKSPAGAPLVLPFNTSPLQQLSRPESSLSRVSGDGGGTARRQGDLYKPMATTVSKSGFFGIGKRTIVEPVTSPPDNPLIDEYLAENNARRQSRPVSISTKDTLNYDPDHPAYNSWQDYRSPSLKSSHRVSESISSFGSEHPDLTSSRECLTSHEPFQLTALNDVLPNEINKFAGFCKGAWRQQIGDTKRAMEERVRPGGVYNQAKYWQCKHCKFEGRSVSTGNKKNGVDTRVFKIADGIQFRWEFMFKSHVAIRDANPDPSKTVFGCIFCCSEGKKTPTFGGIQSLMDHLREHRERLPTGEVLYRMNCLIGRQAAMNEAFDINLISL